MTNLFDILGLTADYALDPTALEKAYFKAQRETHPDLAIGKPEPERIAAFQKSQIVNEAYETLKNPLSRAEHLLEMQGIFANSEDQKDVSPALLMEMMELRERVEEAGNSGVELNAVLNEIKAQAKDSEKTLVSAFAANDYDTAARETTRFSYLMKAIEEAHIMIYRLKALHG